MRTTESLLSFAVIVAACTASASAGAMPEKGKIVYSAPFGGANSEDLRGTVGTNALTIDLETKNVLGGHLGFAFEDCANERLRFCISSVGFCFAVPRQLMVGAKWEVCRSRFQITGKLNITYRGTTRFVFDIAASHVSGEAQERFIFDDEIGLIAMANWGRGPDAKVADLLWNVRVLDSERGLGAGQ